MTRRELLTCFVSRSQPVKVEQSGPPSEVPARLAFSPSSAPLDSRISSRRSRLRAIHRPPGAIEESRFLELCTRCGECESACPHQAIKCADSPDGTPVIEAQMAPCWLCRDKACQTVCEPQALSKEVNPKMGQAQITSSDCLAWQKVPCSTCYERCPVAGAITLDSLARPTVQDSCLGCGVCLALCPAPRNAVILMPALRRPCP